MFDFEDEDVLKVSNQGGDAGENVVGRMKVRMVRKRKFTKSTGEVTAFICKQNPQGKVNDESHCPLQQ